MGPEIDADYIAGFAVANSRATLKPQLAKLFGNVELVTRRLVDDVLKYKRLEGVEATLTLLAESLFPGGRQERVFRDELGGLPQRVQVIWGEEDAIIPVAHARGLPIDVHVVPARAIWCNSKPPPTSTPRSSVSCPRADFD